MTAKYHSVDELTDRDRENLSIASDAARLRDIREWRRRLEAAHIGGYHLCDANVETVLSNVAFLLRILDGRV